MSCTSRAACCRRKQQDEINSSKLSSGVILLQVHDDHVTFQRWLTWVLATPSIPAYRPCFDSATPFSVFAPPPCLVLSGSAVGACSLLLVFSLNSHNW